VDLRGVHLLPVEEVVGLRHGPETLQKGGIRDGVELDLVTHDLAKFLRRKLFAKSGELKPALYSLRVLLTGIHLMRTGEIEADLRRLWTGHTLPYVPDLIAMKAAGEHRAWAGSPGLPDSAILARDVTRLRATLVQASAESHLPERPSTYGALHDLLVRTRLD